MAVAAFTLVVVVVVVGFGTFFEAEGRIPITAVGGREGGR